MIGMRIGIVGSGKIVEECLETTKSIKSITCVALCVREESIKKGEALADKYNVPYVYTDYLRMLQSAEIDFVYIGIINSLHFKYSKLALEANKNVICEKPFTSNVKEAEELKELAMNNKLFLFEAVTFLYSPNFKYIKENIEKIGDIKLIQCNYSQYSSRYDDYKNGIVHAAFDQAFSGGALYDINVYNVHFVVGLFGYPEEIRYIANIGFNGIDTSGILVLEYPNYKAICIGAKDSESPSFAMIQGTEGYIKSESAVNTLKVIETFLIKKSEIIINRDNNNNRFINEFKAFVKIFKEKDYLKCYENLENSIKVMKVLTEARSKAGILYPHD